MDINRRHQALCDIEKSINVTQARPIAPVHRGVPRLDHILAEYLFRLRGYETGSYERIYISPQRTVIAYLLDHHFLKESPDAQDTQPQAVIL